MSKTLTANQSTAAAQTGHSQARIIEIQWESGTVYYTERGTSEINPDPAKTFLPIIASFPMTARNVNMGIVDEGPRQSAQFQIWIDPDDVGNIEVVVGDESPSGTTVKTYIVLQPVSGNLAESDWIALGRYVIDSWRIEYRKDGNRLSFMLSDFAQHKGETTIGRLITADLYPGARDDAFGQMIPQIFGDVEKSPGFLTSAGKRTSIASSINEITGIIFVADAPGDKGFPLDGTIIVGNEKIAYTAVDNSDPFSFGISGTPATRGVDGTVASSHIFGAAVVGEVDKYRFLMADRASVSTAKTITGATNATPIVITSTSHGYSNNDHVFVVGVLGNLVANGLWKIASVAANTFALVDSIGTNDYESGGEAFLSHISAITAPKINEVTLASTDYEVIVFGDGVEQVAAVEVSSLPAAAQDLGFTSLTRLRDLDPPVEWAEGAFNSVADWANAISTADDRHITFANIAEGDSLIIEHNNDLSGNTGQVVGATLRLEYQSLRLGDDVYPGDAGNLLPAITIFDGTTELVSSNIEEPTDSVGSTDLFPDGVGNETEDSTFLFEGLDITSGRQLTVVFKAIDGQVVVANNNLFLSGSQAFHFHWKAAGDLTDGALLNFDDLQFVSIRSSGNGSLDTLPNDGWLGGTGIVFRPFDDGSFASGAIYSRVSSKVIVSQVVQVDGIMRGGPEAFAFAELKIFDSGSGQFVVREATVTLASHIKQSSIFLLQHPGIDFLMSLTVEGRFTEADVLGLEVKIFSSYSIAPHLTEDDIIGPKKFAMSDISIEAVVDLEQTGETIPLINTALVPSSRVIQEVDLSLFVLEQSWALFAGNLKIAIDYPAQTPSNTTTLSIYNIEIQLEVQGGGSSVTLITEDNAQLTADVIGFFEDTTTDTKISSEATITKLLEDSGYYGLTSADHSGLAAAIASATNSGEIDWRLDRRIARQTTLRDLLSSAVSDAGIRYGIDSGVFVFFPELGALVGDSVQSLVRADLTTGVTKERTHIDLVQNQIAVFFRRATTGELGFTRQREANNLSSQLLPWGTRRDTVGAEWIRESLVAVALADRLLDDFSFDRMLIQGTFSSARTLALEIGDVVTITDSLLNLSSVVGRIVGAIFPSPGQQRLTLAIPARRTRLFNHPASGSFVDYFPDQHRTMIVIDGTIVSMIRRTEFAIAGELTEETYNPEVAQGAEFEYLAGSPNSLILSTNPDGFFRGLQFFAGGNLQVHEMEEDNVTYPGTPGLEEADFGFAPDGTLIVAALISIALTTGAAGTITDATNATPIVITLASHGLANGNHVLVADVLGNTAANGLWRVANVAANTFELVGSTGNGAYTSGGTATLSNYNGRLEVANFTEQATL